MCAIPRLFSTVLCTRLRLQRVELCPMRHTAHPLADREVVLHNIIIPGLGLLFDTSLSQLLLAPSTLYPL
jgi:hypothetical protein